MDMYSISSAVIPLLILSVYIGWNEYRKYREQKKVDQSLIRKSMDDLTEAIGKISVAPEIALRFAESLEKVPDMVNGLMEMCKASAAQTDALVHATALLQGTMDGTSSSGDEGDSEEDAAEERREVRKLIRGGVPEQEAEARARERRIYERLGR